MPKRLLLAPAAEYLGVSQHYLRVEAKAGRIPCLKSGNRYIFDVLQVEEYLRQKAMENLKNEPEDIQEYGKLRRIGG
ncbi:MAG: hypothetical protein K0R80_2436 [Clostridia bacterium]|jgi:excisionase family DNA binding protein|nr:hypothetical protein [Clostridia bacterium]